MHLRALDAFGQIAADEATRMRPGGELGGVRHAIAVRVPGRAVVAVGRDRVEPEPRFPVGRQPITVAVLT